MILELFRVRIKQFLGIIKEIGIFRAIILLGLFVFLISLINSNVQKDSYRIFVVVLYALFVFYVNLKRKDTIFVKLYFKNYYFVFLIEDFFISLPLLIILASHYLWIYESGFIMFLLIISSFQIQFNKKTVNSILQRTIPDYNFEWKAGFRKNLYLIVFSLVYRFSDFILYR